MKGFNIGPQPGGSGTLPPVAEFIASLQAQHEDPHHELFGSTLSGIFGPGTTTKKSPHHTSTNSVPGLAIGPRQSRDTRDGSRKKRWGTLIEAAKAGTKTRMRVSRLIGKLIEIILGIFHRLQLARTKSLWFCVAIDTSSNAIAGFIIRRISGFYII